MKSIQKYVGLDVSKEKIAVAIADEGRETPRYWGTIAHKPEAVRKLMKQLAEADTTIEVCYEAGPTGYELHRWLLSMNIACTVVAPSLIPTKPGESIKTDRRDAVRLAQLFRSGELTAVYVPSRDDEALRDLVRARADAREDYHRSKQRLIHFLLRHQIHPPATIVRRWTKAYRTWLEGLSFDRVPEQIAFREYLHTVRECEERIKRIELGIAEQAIAGPHAPVIQALQTLRGVALLTAATLVAEIGSFMRFRSPAQLMAYIGLVPREYSSGQSVKRGRMTKTGNAHLRRTLVESAWSYRHRPAIKNDLEKRQENQSLEVQAISWKAQNRLHLKYRKIVLKGKHKNIAIGAVARELVGFVWAIACQIEKQQQSVAS
jgi:transposase